MLKINTKYIYEEIIMPNLSAGMIAPLIDIARAGGSSINPSEYISISLVINSEFFPSTLSFSILTSNFKDWLLLFNLNLE